MKNMGDFTELEEQEVAGPEQSVFVSVSVSLSC